MRSIEDLESGFMAPLARYGLVQVSGEDAVAFVHGQFSHDITGLKTDAARLAGYCTPEGRLLAAMLAWKSAGDLWLMMPREILPALLKRLQIYILRSKVKMADVSEAFAVTGFAGKKAAGVIAPSLGDMPGAVYGKMETPSGTVIRLPDAFGGARFAWIAPVEAASALSPSFASSLMAADDEDWELGDVEAGLPQVYAATQNRFVPQMVNMDRVDGMSFTKGCYPGQEVIARTQYRGSLKRRMIPAYADILGKAPAADAKIAPGMDIFDAAAPNEPCGILVRAARRNEKRIDCLVVVPREVSGSASLRLGEPDGPTLHVTPLPYALSDETSES